MLGVAHKEQVFTHCHIVTVTMWVLSVRAVFQVKVCRGSAFSASEGHDRSLCNCMLARAAAVNSLSMLSPSKFWEHEPSWPDIIYIYIWICIFSIHILSFEARKCLRCHEASLQGDLGISSFRKACKKSHTIKLISTSAKMRVSFIQRVAVVVWDAL